MTDRVPAFGVPPTLRELLCGAAPYGGSAHRDLFCYLAYTWSALIVQDQKTLCEDVGGSWAMVHLLNGLWKACMRLRDRKAAAWEPDYEVFQQSLAAVWLELGRLLEKRPAEDFEVDWHAGVSSPLDELNGRMTLLLAMLGDPVAVDALPRLLWMYARRAQPSDGFVELHATAIGGELDDGSYRLRWTRGYDGLVDVLAQWRERGMEAIATMAALTRGQIRDAVVEAMQARPKPITVLAALRKEAAEAEQVPPEPEGPGVIVVPRVGGGVKGQSNKDVAAELKGVLAKRLPLYQFPSNRRALVEEASAEAPHARAFFERLVALQDTREHWALPPILAVGDPGGGKTTAVDRFFRRHGLHVERYACDGSSDSAAAGTPRRWLSGEVCLPLGASMTAGYANPVVMWDEINRAGGHRQGSGGTLRDALTSLLEPENARRYRDPYVEAEVDISHVLHVATANSLDGIAPQVRDRFVCLRFPLPTLEHMPVLARRMALEIARRQGLPDDHGELDRAEIQALSKNWPGGSLRSLKQLVEVAMRVRVLAPWATRH